ncbi:MAG: hypothetical protein QXS02_04660 [Candidatus Thermoplasmatota archaeon]
MINSIAEAGVGFKKSVKAPYGSSGEMFIKNQYLNKEEEFFVFKPSGITLYDDAFHGSDSLFSTEWWYFDAILDNNYSIQLVINIFGIIQEKVVLTKINIYRYGELLITREEIYSSRDFTISREEPRILIKGREVLRGYIVGDIWFYNVNISIDDVSISLMYTGINKGWMGSVLVGDWVVALPKACVSGFISIDNTLISVRGIGYHDHNYDLTLGVLFKFGWYWGKAHTSNFTLVWSYQLDDTRFDKAPLVVINNGREKYFSINPHDIEFTTNEYRYNNGCFIPMDLTLRVSTDNSSVFIKMTPVGIHHVNILFFKYWRFHMKCTGYITVDGCTEMINQVEITEIARFR